MSTDTSNSFKKRRQFAPSEPKPRKVEVLIRPVSQVQLRLKVSRPDEDLFINTVGHVLRWLSKRAGLKLPKDAWEGKPFTLEDIGAQHTVALALDEPRYWTARLDDADKAVAMRTWTTEIGIGQTGDGDVLFGSRLICTTRGEDHPFDRSVPVFVRSIVRGQTVLIDHRPLRPGPTQVSTDADVDAMIEILEDPQRRCPALVMSLAEGCSDFSKGIVDADFVYNKTLGAAHIFVLTGDASFQLTNRFGKELSVYRGAVRMFRPGLNRNGDPFAHPLTLAERILQIEADSGEMAFETQLSSQALAVTAFAPDREDALPSFDKLRHSIATLERKAARSAGSNDSDLLSLADQEIEKLEADLNQQKEIYDGLLLAMQSEMSQAEEVKNEVLARSYALRERIQALQTNLRQSGEKTPIPTDLKELETWAHQHLEGSVTLLSRALRGAKKSEYNNPTLAYEALLLLRDFYVPMRRETGTERSQKYEAELSRLGLENSFVGNAVDTFKEDYTVMYCGLPRVLNMHLKHGTSREPHLCFRLYYFWDEESQCAVVGWLTSHLDNASS